jgi:cytochrome P450
MEQTTEVGSAPDIFDPETLQCPYAAYQQLRDETPAYRSPGTDTWILTRYDDIVTALSRPDVFHHGPAPAKQSSQQNDQGQPLTLYKEDGVVIQAPLNSDPPNHRQYRNLIDKHFSVRGVEQHRDLITRETNRLMDEWVADGHVELIEQFANPMPREVINALFGFDRERSDDLRRWAQAWTQPFTGRLSEEEEAYVVEQLAQFRAYIKEQVRLVREHPNDSVVSHLSHAIFQPADEPERPLSPPELVSMIEMMYTGGTMTTEHSFGLMVTQIIKNEGLEDKLREDRELVSGVIEESLRLESVVAGMYRNTAEDVVIGGTEIPKGSSVHIRFGAANRDERFFPDPEELDPNRANRRRHVAFGLGEHHCPGSPLARMEMAIALNAMLDRTRDWRLAPSEDVGRIRPGFIVRGLQELQIDFDPIG